jgi:hypothetical protein
VVDSVSKILADDQSVGQIVWARYAFAIPVLLAAGRRPAWRNLFSHQRASQPDHPRQPLLIVAPVLT